MQQGRPWPRQLVELEKGALWVPWECPPSVVCHLGRGSAAHRGDTAWGHMCGMQDEAVSAVPSCHFIPLFLVCAGCLLETGSGAQRGWSARTPWAAVVEASGLAPVQLSAAQGDLPGSTLSRIWGHLGEASGAACLWPLCPPTLPSCTLVLGGAKVSSPGTCPGEWGSSSRAPRLHAMVAPFPEPTPAEYGPVSSGKTLLQVCILHLVGKRPRTRVPVPMGLSPITPL